MAYRLDLTGCWQKLERAKGYIDLLHTEISRQGYARVEGTPGAFAVAIPLARTFDPEKNEIVFYVERLIEIGNDWGLIVGDAAHNMRCALDHLAWQLALRYFRGVAPTARNVVRNIQFPVVTDKPNWSGTPHRKYMIGAHRAKVKKFQPFNITAKARRAGIPHWLNGLAGFDGLDNVDKHRSINLTNFAMLNYTLTNPENLAFTDCAPILVRGKIRAYSSDEFRNPPHVGDVVLRFPVTPLGLNPDVNFEARLTGFVAVRETWEVLYTLQVFAFGVAEVLKAFEPRP
jgi:hypothetical protein